MFVAYAGVTKVASVAEEVENPGRNIPLGMLLSVGAVLVLYPAVVYVIVGTTSPTVLATTTTPVADAAGSFFGTLGVDFVTVVAIVALIGAANAGIRAASRYPLAMSRNSLAPQVLQQLGPRGTPTVSLIATGVVLGVAAAAVLDWRAEGEALRGHGGVLLTGMVIVMAGVGLVAALGPARRGLRIEPTEALKAE